MGEKKKNNGGEQKKKEDKGNNNNVTVVLKTDLHCEGCATKVLKCIRLIEGVETAIIGEGQKITVVGKVDPVKLREKLEQKTHKKVELISPQPKKDNGDNNNKENSKGKGNEGKENNQKQEKKKESKDKNSKDDDSKSDDKKSKEKGPPVTTAVLKVHLHCEGCIQKIHKIITKTKGYEDVKIDKQKDLVTVTGAMDMKALAEVLKKHLKKDVEIVPPKKEEKKKENGGGGGGDKEKGGGGDKKKGGGGGGDGGEAGDGGGEKMEGHKMQLQGGYPYPQPQPFFYGPGTAGDQFHYNPYPVGSFHAPQIFSDENPNACSVM